MKRFVIRVIFFLLPIILFSYVADTFLSTYLKKSNSFAQKEYPTWNAILEGSVNSEIVIYGSSRAWRHFNSAMIENGLEYSTYNLGIDGHPFHLQYLRHLLLLKNNSKPKLIIHSIDIGTLQKREELYNSDQFLPYMLWNRDIWNSISTMEGYDFYDSYIPLLRYYGKFQAIKTAFKMFFFPKANKVERIKGYQGAKSTFNEDFDKAKKSMEYFTAKVDSSTYNLFKQYLEECRMKNIMVVLVYSPEYIEGQKFMSNRNEIVKIFKNFSINYGIPFIDFFNDEISYRKEYFYNATHMNKKGADLFTHKLINELKSNKLVLKVLESKINRFNKSSIKPL